MLIQNVQDRLMLFKESFKTRLFSGPLFSRFALDGFNHKAFIRYLCLRKVERIIQGKPNSIMLIADGMVIRVPLDELTAARCRQNKRILTALKKTSIAGFVPRCLASGNFNGYPYYCEERLPGLAIDIPISKMDELVVKAADFITKFHQETARPVVINEANFTRLFGREFQRLKLYVNDEYKAKLDKIEALVRQQVMNKAFKTVWLHGDYNIENTLFDTRTWQLKGVIDWDLSRREGLPLLDIFYLLFYKEALTKGNTVTDIYKEKCSGAGFAYLEDEIIKQYVHSLSISTELIRPLSVMFWINHITERYRQQLMANLSLQNSWMQKNVYSVAEIILEHS